MSCSVSHVIRTTLKQWKSLKFDPPPSENACTRWLPKSAGVTTSRISTPVQNCITIRLGDFAPHICEVAYQMFTRLVFWGSSSYLPPRPLHRFWRSTRQKTSFRARMCLFGGPENKFFTFCPHFLPKRNFLVDFRRDLEHFRSKRALTWGASSVNTP